MSVRVAVISEVSSAGSVLSSQTFEAENSRHQAADGTGRPVGGLQPWLPVMTMPYAKEYSPPAPIVPSQASPGEIQDPLRLRYIPYFCSRYVAWNKPGLNRVGRFSDVSST